MIHEHDWWLTITGKNKFVVHCQQCAAKFTPDHGKTPWWGAVPEKLA
jgi:hypothetical protein